MKFRKKPVVIDAWQSWKNAGTNTEAWPPWIMSAITDEILFNKGAEIYIKTLEGDMHVSDGDWIIKGVQGELYPCRPHIFVETYDLVTD